MDPLRHLRKYRAHRVSHFGEARQLQAYAKPRRDLGVVARSGRTDGHQRQAGRELQCEHRRRTARRAVALQRHRGEQRRQLARIALVHLARVVQPGLDQLLADGGDHLVDHLARRTLRVALRPGSEPVQVAHLPGPDPRPQDCCFAAPVRRHAQHMCRVAGREAAVNREPLAFEPGQRTRQTALVQVGALHIDRALRQPLPGLRLVVGQPRDQRGVGVQALRKTDLASVRRLALLALKNGQQLGVLVHQQAQRNDTPRTDHQALTAAETHFAVTPQADRVDLHGFDHRTPMANHRAVKTELGSATAHDRYVGGRAAHIGHDGVLLAAQRASAQHTRRRSRQDGSDRPAQRAFNIDEATVTFDDHQRRVDAARGERAAYRVDQQLHLRHHARVECHRQRAARRAQARRELVPASHRLVAQGLDPAAQLQLVRWVAHSKTRRYGKGRNARRLAQDRRPRRVLVQRLQRHTARIVPTAERDYGLHADQVDQPAGLDLRGVVARQQHAHRCALALYHRVGRQRGR